MINFRYHVVSLTAVFLALAIGLVVGTAALNGPVADSLKDRVAGLSKTNEQLREEVESANEQLNQEEAFVNEVAPGLLTGKLTGRRVLLVNLPSGRDQVDGVAGMLRQAGATVTGRIDIRDKFVEPDSSVDLLSLVAQAARPTVPATGLPINSDGVETSGAQLASALFDRTEGTPASEADRGAVLAAYASAGYLTVEEKVTGPAEAVVVVSGQPYVDQDAAEKDQSVVRLVSQLDRSAAVVVAGRGANDGNLVAAVRGDAALSKSISTVDNANTPQGQLATALAVIQQVVEKKSGQYGHGTGANSLIPA